MGSEPDFYILGNLTVYYDMQHSPVATVSRLALLPGH